MKKIFVVVLLTILFFTPVFGSVFAQSVPCGAVSGGSTNYDFQSGGQSCPPTVDEVGLVLGSIVEVILAFSAVVFFLMILLNGFNFITALSDAEKLQNARKGLLFTVIGFGLIFASFAFIQIIATVTHLTGGLTLTSTGGIQFNLLSTYKETPIPSYYVNTHK